MVRSQKIQQFAQVDSDVPRAFHLGPLLFNNQLQIPLRLCKKPLATARIETYQLQTRDLTFLG